MIQEATTANRASPLPAVDREEVRQIVTGHGQDRGGLIAILEEIQGRYGYLPEDALRMVSEETGRSLVDIYGIATFYRAFSLVPRGRHLICACLGTACHVRGAPRVVEELERQLGIPAGETTPDGEFTLETVNCLGACALGPVVVIDGRYFSKVGRSKVRQLLDAASVGFEKTETEDGTFPINVSCPRCNHNLMDADTRVNGVPSMRMILATDSVVGTCHLSSVYGSASVLGDTEIPDGTVCTLFCPRCHAELAGDWRCDDCGAPMATLAVHGGGMVNVCRRRGCPGRRLDLDCVNG